jgi:two-component system chemotaxis response regulator CheB
MKHKIIRNLDAEMIIENTPEYIVAIGISTGGPKALAQIMPMFPVDFPAALLIVQHMPPGFTRSLAERLNNTSRISVKEAEDGEIIRAGYAYIAPGSHHMLAVKAYNDMCRIKLTDDPPLAGHRPSVNAMMDSLSRTGLDNIIGVIMTGMGNDGSDGICKLKLNNKAYIISQDENTCVVYGMPKAAVQTGMVDKVVPLTEIAQEIMKIVEVHK